MGFDASTKGALTEGSTSCGAAPGSVGWQALAAITRRSKDLPNRILEQSSDSKDGSPILLFFSGLCILSTLQAGSRPFGQW